MPLAANSLIRFQSPTIFEGFCWGRIDRTFGNLADRRSYGMQFQNSAIDLRMRHTSVAWQIALMFVSSLIYAPRDAGAAESTVSRAVKKLFRAFVGDWSVVETFEQSEFFPKGGFG
jgi:hypothetical protein